MYSNVLYVLSIFCLGPNAEFRPLIQKYTVWRLFWCPRVSCLLKLSCCPAANVGKFVQQLGNIKVFKFPARNPLFSSKIKDNCNHQLLASRRVPRRHKLNEGEHRWSYWAHDPLTRYPEIFQGIKNLQMRLTILEGISKTVDTTSTGALLLTPPSLKSDWNFSPHEGQAISIPPMSLGNRNIWPHCGHFFSIESVMVYRE